MLFSFGFSIMHAVYNSLMRLLIKHGAGPTQCRHCLGLMNFNLEGLKRCVNAVYIVWFLKPFVVIKW